MIVVKRVATMLAYGGRKSKISPPMTVKDALAQLEKLANPKVRARNTRLGADDNQFGVKMGDIRKVAA